MRSDVRLGLPVSLHVIVKLHIASPYSNPVARIGHTRRASVYERRQPQPGSLSTLRRSVSVRARWATIESSYHFSQNFLSGTISLQPPCAIGKKAELSKHVQSDIRL